MIRLIEKKGLFSFLDDQKFSIDCDNCGKRDISSGIVHEGHLIEHSSQTEVVCQNCFSKGLENFRSSSYKHSSDPIQTNRTKFTRPDNPCKRVCALCGIDLYQGNDIVLINTSQKFLCRECVSKSHPDDKHSYFPGDDSRKWGNWGLCSSCGTLRVYTNGFRYWSLNAGHNIQTIPSCLNKTPIYDCNHNFILAVDLTKDKDDVKRMSKKELRHFRMVEPDVTRADFIYSTCGYKLFWCTKCGEIERELPDWYKEFL